MAESVLAVFGDPASAAAGARAARAAGAAELRARMPAPFPEVIEAIGRPKSLLGYVSFAGAAVGLAGGYALCAWTSLDWPLVVGGKPIVAIPSFTVIAFEVTVLVGVLVTNFTLGLLAIRTRRGHPVPADPRFSRDCVGVLAIGASATPLEAAFRDAGALEVRRV